MSKIASQAERTRRAVAACRDLLETADWLRDRLKRDLESFGLSLLEYRVLETLDCDGPQYQRAISRKFRSSDTGVLKAIRRFEKMGWVRRERSTLPSKARMTGPKARGPKIALVHLTPEGERLIAYVFPKHASAVKAEMRALEGREQLNLSRLCRKLRGRLGEI
jgi:MarR family transcriptional regulator, 2-MHQ and catechol-resistance regulon repressor